MLAQARAEMARAAQPPLLGRARSAWTEAEQALAEAERAEEDGPGAKAEDAAYVALRMAERARLSALYEAERDALEHARATVRRLAEDDARREALLADAARRQQETAHALAAAREARRRALEDVRDGAGGDMIERQEGLLFRFSTKAIFLPGTSLLRDGARERLAALAAALRRPPACDVRLQVIADIAGQHTSAAILAERRIMRVHDTLLAHGVADEAFLAPLHHPPAGTQVDVLVVERPPPSPR
jgi:outer membrane protein OmpA-like peptidoglycan-associated protein